MTAQQALELLTASRHTPAGTVVGTCGRGCAAMVSRDDLLDHERWHDAVAALADRVFS